MSPAYRQLLKRLAAPAAFLLAATIAVLLVRSALHAGDTAPPRRDATPAPARHAGSRPARKKPAKRRQEPRRQTRAYETIEAGDTLDTIALEHETSVQHLLDLNPGIDPHSLHVGQRVRVR